MFYNDKMDIFAITYFPKLVGDYHGVTPITKSWRHIMRERARNEHPPTVILANTRPENRTPVLKEICDIELIDYVAKKKIKRNHERALLSLHGIRKNIPRDVINNIQEYMTFVKYF